MIGTTPLQSWCSLSDIYPALTVMRNVHANNPSAGRNRKKYLAKFTSCSSCSSNIFKLEKLAKLTAALEKVAS